MSKLSQGQRDRLPDEVFAGPGRSYPVPDKGHAVDAKARARDELEAGNLSSSAYRRIVTRANEVLNR